MKENINFKSDYLLNINLFNTFLYKIIYVKIMSNIILKNIYL